MTPRITPAEEGSPMIGHVSRTFWLIFAVTEEAGGIEVEESLHPGRLPTLNSIGKER